MLTLRRFHHRDKRSQSYSLYDCKCGRRKVIRDGSVKAGEIKSCGCLQKRRASEANFKHGLTATPEYSSWEHMNGRCFNREYKQWKDYGGRGITVCVRWREFKNFLTDMGPRPKGTSIDRIDVDGNYEPRNCRWATPHEQMMNRRKKQVWKQPNHVCNEFEERRGGWC